MPSGAYTVESCKVETSDGVKLHTRIFEQEGRNDGVKDNLVIVLVHPYSLLVGCQDLLKGIASGLASRDYKSVTFDMRVRARLQGGLLLLGLKKLKMSLLFADGFLIIFPLTGFCWWDLLQVILMMSRLGKRSLEHARTGAPISGSAVDTVDQVVGYVSLGYPFGLMASILFGRHPNTILKSPKPKLFFVMGTRDGFTSVDQLKKKLASAAGRNEIHLLEGASHFEMEGPAYDDKMVNLILKFIGSL